MTPTAQADTLHLERPLPVAWDGRTVTWRAWTPTGPTFICDRTKRKHGLTIPACDHCGSVRFLSAPGIIDPAPGASDPGEYLRLDRAGRPLYAQEPARPLVGLTAQRCAQCGHDTVYEWATHQTWNLGPEDYGPTGSTDPTAEAP